MVDTNLDSRISMHKNTRVSSTMQYLSKEDNEKEFKKIQTNNGYKLTKNTNSMLGIPSGFLLSTSITNSKEGLLKNNPSINFKIQNHELKLALKTYLLENER